MTDGGPVFGVLVPGHQTFTAELKPLGGQTFGPWLINGLPDNSQLLIQVLDPATTSAEIEMDDGTVVEGQLVDVPAEAIGSAKVFVAGFSSHVSAEGTSYDPDGVVVAFGSGGRELGRRRFSSG
jgi:hypothetical protein